MFTGLSAFPLTPVSEGGVDEDAFAGLVRRLAEAGVDSIGALGSTGSYAHLARDERRALAGIAVEAAGDVPVIVGVGALRTRDVLGHVDDAQAAGAAGLLLAPVAYQALTDEEVYGLYRDVAAAAAVPVVVYDNPTTTHVHISDELHARIAGLPGVTAVKIPPTSLEPREATDRICALRAVLPEGYGIGISGDASAAVALAAGCDAWFPVIGGVLSEPALEIVRAAARGDHEHARSISARLSPLWSLFGRHGSLRVAAAIAEHLELIGRPDPPRPLLPLPDEAAERSEPPCATWTWPDDARGPDDRHPSDRCRASARSEAGRGQRPWAADGRGCSRGTSRCRGQLSPVELLEDS